MLFRAEASASPISESRFLVGPLPRRSAQPGQDGGRRHGATLGATLGAALSPTAVPGLRGAAVGWRRLLRWGARVGFVPSVLGLPAFPPKLTKRRGPGLVGLGCLLQMSRRQDPRELPSRAV